MGANFENDFLKVARSTGIDIFERDGRYFWQGPVSGKRKPQGPLAGKKIGIIVASELFVPARKGILAGSH